MRETGANRLNASWRVIMTFFVSVLAGVLLTSAVSGASEQPFTVDESTGDVRNIVTLSIGSKDEPLTTGLISVRNSQGVIVKEMSFTPDSQDKQRMTLVWKTNDVADGGYSVQYRASNAANETVERTKNVNVLNAVPLITLEAKPEGRVIGGVVSRSDVDIFLNVDGQKIEVAPRIALQPDENGSYIWSAELPAEIAYDKEYTVEAVAAVKETNVASAPVQTKMTLQAPAPAPLANETPAQPTGPPVVVPILDFALEIGRFVAPVLPKAPETQLFGVPTTDLTDDMAEKSIAPIASPARPEVAVAQKITDTEQVPPPIKPSGAGWMILGVEWYWIVIIAVIVSAVVFSLARIFYIRTPESAFIRAESTQ